MIEAVPLKYWCLYCFSVSEKRAHSDECEASNRKLREERSKQNRTDPVPPALLIFK